MIRVTFRKSWCSVCCFPKINCGINIFWRNCWPLRILFHHFSVYCIVRARKMLLHISTRFSKTAPFQCNNWIFETRFSWSIDIHQFIAAKKLLLNPSRLFFVENIEGQSFRKQFGKYWSVEAKNNDENMIKSLQKSTSMHLNL